MPSPRKAVLFSFLLLALAIPAWGQQDVDKLVQGTYTGAAGFKTIDGHPVLFVGKDGTVSTFPQRYELYISPTTSSPVSDPWDLKGGYGFRLVWGSYQGGKVRGYWITTPAIGPRVALWKQHFFCWQPDGPGGSVQFWNQDRAAQGPPEDLEMWYFEIVDRDKQLVRIKNKYRGYVGLDGSKRLITGVSQPNAQPFRVDFGVTPFSDDK